MTKFGGTHIGPTGSARPGSPVAGQTFYNTATKQWEMYDGAQWMPLGSARAFAIAVGG